jgi:hypothetical protein
LLGGWLLAVVSVFFWAAVRLDSGAVVSPSSPEASRDSVWMIWSISIARVVLVRLRFPAFCDDEVGDDIVLGRIGERPNKGDRNADWMCTLLTAPDTWFQPELAIDAPKLDSYAWLAWLMYWLSMVNR